MDTEAKSSSRVLAPPGGASSNIFGGYQDDQPKPKRPIDNDVFNQSSAPQNSSPAHKDIRSRNQRQGALPPTAYNPITGEPIEDPKQREAEEQQEKKEASASYNDHQAQQNQAHPQRQQQGMAQPGQGEQHGEQFRSTRVSQPPGGRSTKLWWSPHLPGRQYHSPIYFCLWRCVD